MAAADALRKAQEQSVALFLERQRVEVQRQQLTLQAQRIDHELVLLDGEIRALTPLAVAPAPDGSANHG